MTHGPKWPVILSFIKVRKQIFEEGEFTFLHFELVVAMVSHLMLSRQL